MKHTVGDHLGLALMASVGAGIPLVLLYLMVHAYLVGTHPEIEYGGYATMALLSCIGLYWVARNLVAAWNTWRAK